MNDLQDQIKSKMDLALAESANEASIIYDPANNFEGFVRECGKKFIEKKIDLFPFLCEVARIQTALIKKDLEGGAGYKGKFSDSYGWSETREWKWEHEIPKELYLFMTNLVYRDFWAQDNEKISKKFMMRIVRGDDPMEILLWVKKIYGANNGSDTQKLIV